MKVNRRLRVLRAERDLSQMETAAQAQIALNRYWRIENGYAEPTEDEQDALAKVFGLAKVEVFQASVSA